MFEAENQGDSLWLLGVQCTGKNLPGNAGDPGVIPGSGRSQELNLGEIAAHPVFMVFPEGSDSKECGSDSKAW